LLLIVAGVGAGIGAGIWQRHAVAAWVTRAWTHVTGSKTEPSSPPAAGPHDRELPVEPASGAKPSENAPLPPVVSSGSGKGTDAAKGTETGKEGEANKETFADPSALPQRAVFRPAAGVRYTSLQTAIREAAPGETIWIGPGELKEAIAPITQTLTLKGAGRDVTRLNLTGLHGLVLSGDDGGLEDLEICCAKSGAVLEIAGTFHGSIARVRIAKGEGWGILVRGSAAPTITGALIEDNKKGRVSVQEQATPVLTPQ
jgi:hypothetical protein